MFRELVVSIPPRIASLDVSCSADTLATMDAALREIAVVDRAHGATLAALGTVLLRTESVASSKIEDIVAGMDEYARALHGSKANASAAAMAAATDALNEFMRGVDGVRPIAVDMLIDAHRRLMRDDAHEQRYAGRIRDIQNWIGGSDYSPRNALYVPPPPDLVPELLRDLMVYVNRVDVPILVQVAVAHAQFESIHPFTDGNGRIGRGLMNVILRHRGATSSVVVPIASGLVGNRERYFDHLTRYRLGDPEPIMGEIAVAALVAARESQRTAQRLADLPDEWRRALGRVRRGSVTDRLLGDLTAMPVFSAEDLVDRYRGPTSAIYASIDRLHGAGVLRVLTPARRHRVWGAADVLDELDDLNTRIDAATR